MDEVKFFLIILVIFGHSGHFLHLDNSLLSVKIVRHVIHTIYLFHMPLFIMISGYFSKRTDDSIKFLKSIWKLIRIFLTFHFVWMLIDYWRGETIDFVRLVSPAFTLWYLLSLVYWRVILQVFPKRLLKCPKVVMSIVCVIGLASGLVPLTNEFSIHRTLTFMPCFFLGYYTREHQWMEKLKGIPFQWIVLPAVILVFIENHLRLDIYGRVPYASLLDFVKRGFFLFSSVIISVAALRCIYPPRREMKILVAEGEHVIFYYVYHAFVLLLLSMAINRMGIEQNGFVLIAETLVTILIIYVLRRISLFQYFVK